MRKAKVEKPPRSKIPKAPNLPWQCIKDEEMIKLTKDITQSNQVVFARSIKYLLENKTHKALIENIKQLDDSHYEYGIISQMIGSISTRFEGEIPEVKTLACNIASAYFFKSLGIDRNLDSITSYMVDDWIIKIYSEYAKPTLVEQPIPVEQ